MLGAVHPNQHAIKYGVENKLKFNPTSMLLTNELQLMSDTQGGRGYSQYFTHTEARVIFGYKILNFNIF